MPKEKSKPVELTKWGFTFGKPDMERIGLFAEMPYMNGKGYVSPFATEKSKNIKSFICPGHKIVCGTQDGLFESEFRRIFEKEVIVRGKKPPKVKNISERPFISCCGSKHHATPGDYFGCFSGNISAFSPKKRPVPKKAPENRPLLTSPGKKGGPGYIDTTIGKYPSYMWSKYGQKPKYKQYGSNLAGPMRTMIHPQPYFGPDPYVDPPNVKTGRVYMRPTEKSYGKPLGTGIYIPTGPAKWPGGMHAGGFDKFPEHIPERYKSVHEALKPKREPKVFQPQSMANKSIYNTSILNQNVDFRINQDNHAVLEPTYLKYMIKH